MALAPREIGAKYRGNSADLTHEDGVLADEIERHVDAALENADPKKDQHVIDLPKSIRATVESELERRYREAGWKNVKVTRIGEAGTRSKMVLERD
jgi:hypothetical protein